MEQAARGQLIRLDDYRKPPRPRASMGDGFVCLRDIPEGDALDLAVELLRAIKEAARTGRPLPPRALLSGTVGGGGDAA